jgi:hypothetical protein
MVIEHRGIRHIVIFTYRTSNHCCIGPSSHTTDSRTEDVTAARQLVLALAKIGFIATVGYSEFEATFRTANGG